MVGVGDDGGDGVGDATVFADGNGAGVGDGDALGVGEIVGAGSPINNAAQSASAAAITDPLPARQIEATSAGPDS